MKRAFSCSLAVAATACVSVVATGQTTIVDTSFTAAEGYTDGELRNFATITPLAGADGTWLGQTGAIVDTTGTGTATIQGAFRRNHWNMGALGGQSGGTGDTEGGGISHPNPGGFAIGDAIQITQEYQFILESGTANAALLQTGVRSDFVLAGFESAPNLGVAAAYNPFEDGSLKVFTDITRSGTDGAANPFALFIEPLDIGIDNGWDGAAYTNPTDLVSDTFKITWDAVYDGADTWTSTELIVENVDTETVLGTASVDKPDVLETVTVAGSGAEAFGAFRLARGGIIDVDGVIATTDAFSFTYTAAGGEVLEGDYDGNGFVSQADLDLVLLNWGATAAPAGFDEAAIPGGGPFDSLVSQNELDGVLLNWGNGTPPAPSVTAVPEPTTAALLGLAGFAMLSRRSA